ncbi:hypothetical protein SERLA73DRAFT_123158 [Serpula lacrymans var. lacrymans S7.3]|uniref:PhoX domain-containing protein n=1 Tax=Serpula lacrymans var. lacrymans (strain S7.3) TaxID=936435 RepID=F8PX25_SERL3|nr:hypothetical protein SERLA73DRAFT_123158 [Serpula lacrymans var. lacrymans S7.3]
MHRLASKKVLFAVAFVAILIPATFHAISSPAVFILVLPLTLVLAAVAYLPSTVFLGYKLDARRKIQGNVLSRASRPFSFCTPAAWQAVLTRSEWSQNLPQSLPSVYPAMPTASSALNDIMIFIVRDFVLAWYKDLSSSPSFPTAVSSVLHDSVERLVHQITVVDPSALLVMRILPMVTAHIEQFRQAEIALLETGLGRRLRQSEEVDMLLASKYATIAGGKLHPAVENLSSTFTRQSEEMHLRETIDKALSSLLPERECQSKAVRVVVREILACAVFYPIMDIISEPDFWNRIIDQVAGAAIHQQRLISRVRNVLEAQSPSRHSRHSSFTDPLTDSDVVNTVHQVEKIANNIDNCLSLPDAQRLKDDIVEEISKTRLLLVSPNKKELDHGKNTEDIIFFLDRLHAARRKVEKRISVLGSDGYSMSPDSYDAGIRTRLTLREVLKTPNLVPFFMEFMESRHRSVLVQFWLTVESFRHPLEPTDSTSEADDYFIQNSSSPYVLKDDISMIKNLYFSTSELHPSLSIISKEYVDTVRSSASGTLPLSPTTERKVHRSIISAQRQVEQEMEHDYDEFARSDLVQDIEFSNLETSRPSSFKLTSEGLSMPSSSAKAPPSVLLDSSSTSKSLLQDFEVSRQGMPRAASASLTSPTTPSPNINSLFSPASDSSSENSRPPLFDGSDEIYSNTDESRRIETIRAAVTDIIATDQQQAQWSHARAGSSSKSLDASPRSRIIGTQRKGMFDDDDDNDNDDADDDNEEIPSDEGGSHNKHERGSNAEQRSFQLAGPGDLQLSYEIARLEDKTARLEAQDAMLNTLIKKAELTGDIRELKLLQKSKSSLSRDLRELRFQKTQYEQQESANRLISNRTGIMIVNSTVGEEGGKSVVRYLVEVQQRALDGTFASGWVVARRYNEFLSMHNKLRDRYPAIRNLDFPGKRLVTTLSGTFVDARRQALEKYMQNLIAIPEVCEGDELRAFLSRESPFMASGLQGNRTSGPSSMSRTSLVRTVYRSVTESIDDMFFGTSMLDVMVQRLTKQVAEVVGIIGSAVNDEDFVAQTLKGFGKTNSAATFMHMPGDLKPLEGETSTSTFSAPICDLILTVFDLNKKNNWLRRQAIVIILQQVLGDTIERKLRDVVKSLLEESHVMVVINFLRDTIWPGGQLKPSGQPRTAEEKLRSRDEANRKLSALVPDLAANMIGRSNVRGGASLVFAALQNRRLNQHLAYTIVDEV